MKKNFCKALAMLFVVFMMMNTVAFADTTESSEAAPGIGYDNSEAINEVTVTLSGLTAGEEATILVVNDGVVGVTETDAEGNETTTTLADVVDTDIVYINQETIADDGTATFTLDASNATGTKVDIFCGYTSIAAAADVLVAEDVTIKATSAPEVNTAEGAKTAVGTADKLTSGYTRVFIQLENAADAANWTPFHTGEGSEIYYTAQRVGYDCLLNTEKTAIADILAELEWTNSAPTATITLYGDGSGDGRISAADVAPIKKLLNKTGTLTLKQSLALEVSGDERISAADVAQLKKVLNKTLTSDEFTILTK